MPISTGSISSATGTTAVSTFSWVHTVGPADSLLVVGVAVGSTSSTTPGGGVASVRLGTTDTGSTFTQAVVGNSTAGLRIGYREEFWYLKNPATGLSTRIHVAFNNSSISHFPAGYGIGFQGADGVGTTTAGASIGASGPSVATVSVAGANDWAVAMFGKRVASSWTTAANSSDVLLVRSTAGNSNSVIVLRSELPGTSGQRTISAANITAGTGRWIGISITEPTAGGPSSLGLPAVVGSAAISAGVDVERAVKVLPAGAMGTVSPVGVRRAIKPSPAAGGSISSPVSIQRPLSLSVVGSGAMGAPISAYRSLVASPSGNALVLIAFLATDDVLLGQILMSGLANWNLPYSVHRGLSLVFHTPAGSAGMSVIMGGISPSKVLSDAGLSLANRMRAASLRIRGAEDRRVPGHHYAGPIGPIPHEHPVYPPGTMDAVNPDAYVEAAAAYDAIMREPIEEAVNIHLLLGRKLRAIELGRPLVERPPTKDKILQDVERRMAKEVNRSNRAKMAWVRSFKKKT